MFNVCLCSLCVVFFLIFFIIEVNEIFLLCFDFVFVVGVKMGEISFFVFFILVGNLML